MKLDAHLTPAERTAEIRKRLGKKHTYIHVTKPQRQAKGRAELCEEEALEHDERASQYNDAYNALLVQAMDHESHAEHQHAVARAAAAARNDAASANAHHQGLAHEAAALQARNTAEKFKAARDEQRLEAGKLRVAAQRWLDEGGVSDDAAGWRTYDAMCAVLPRRSRWSWPRRRGSPRPRSSCR